MKGSLCHEYETGIPAEEVWQIYGTLRLAQLVPQLLPQIAKSIESIEGDGGVGTVLHITFAPGLGMECYKERFIKIDDKNFIKEAITVEGGFLDAGFLSYLVRFEIVQKGSDSSIIRSTIEYETDDKSDVDVSIISTDILATIADAATKYLKEKKNQILMEESK